MLQCNRGHAALLFASVLFGLAFIFQRHAAQSSDALWFNAWRFGLATLFLGVCWRVQRWQHPQLDYGRWFIFGSIGGIFMFCGIMAQQWGLIHTTAGKSGFLTGLYVVIVPIIGVFLGQRPGQFTVIAVVLAVMGLYCFAGIHTTNRTLNWNIGDTMTLLGTLCWALQVLWTSIAVRHCRVLAFSVMQIAVVTLLSIFGVVVWHTEIQLYDLPLLREVVWDVLFTGIGSSAIAFFLQSIGQRRVSATHAAIILSLESVFALLFGWLFLDEVVTVLMLIGCAFMLAAMLIAQYDEIHSVY